MREQYITSLDIVSKQFATAKITAHTFARFSTVNVALRKLEAQVLNDHRCSLRAEDKDENKHLC